MVDLVRVTVGVRDGDNRDAELARFGDGDVLLTRVDDIDRPWQALHLRHPAEEALEPLVFLFQLGDRLLAAGESPVVADGPEAVEAVDLAPHDGEVGEHPAHPAMVHKRHT